MAKSPQVLSGPDPLGAVIKTLPVAVQAFGEDAARKCDQRSRSHTNRCVPEVLTMRVWSLSHQRVKIWSGGGLRTRPRHTRTCTLEQSSSRSRASWLTIRLRWQRLLPIFARPRAGLKR